MRLSLTSLISTVLALPYLTLAQDYSSSASASTCTPFSAAACPPATAYDPCCAYICAEAQVPFLVCQTTSATFLAQCTQCPIAVTGSPTSETTTASETGSATTQGGEGGGEGGGEVNYGTVVITSVITVYETQSCAPTY